MNDTIEKTVWATRTGSRSAKSVLLCTAFHSNETGLCRLTNDDISELCEMSTRTVRRALIELAARGLVRRVEDGYQVELPAKKGGER